ncbi:hypothetical protein METBISCDRAFT_22686 [Metschnikowia bicuspidata]|uniref:Uncharacterized protein n=1 Tax=Metschnikowia bicuspidata TaxID=27322 RepID=A0A4P9Z6Y4_9ASCO|nr:hypothetical protein METBISCDRAFT_25142 [Metschnikowia bicuspidata]RKP31138.1 hypothetical protein METBISCDRAFT_22686 [Metschnikowia bicuspidata]
MATIPLATDATLTVETPEPMSAESPDQVSGGSPKKLLHVDLKNRYRRPESRLSTMYKTGFVPNTNVKDLLKIIKRARFSTQDHLLTYPIYKSAYSGFSRKHPKVMKFGEGAVRRAEAIPPLRATMNFKDRATERVLQTADIWVPCLKKVEVQHLRQPFDNLFQAVENTLQAAVVRPTTQGIVKMRRALKSLGSKILSVMQPLVFSGLKRTPKIDPPETEEPLIEDLYEQQYQVLVKILGDFTELDCNFCDLVKFLYTRSQNDGENGKRLYELILTMGLEALSNAAAEVDGARNDAGAVDSADESSETHPLEAVENELEQPADELLESDADAVFRKVMRSRSAKAGISKVGPARGTIASPVEAGLADEVSLGLSITLDAAGPEKKDKKHEAEERPSSKQNKSVRFTGSEKVAADEELKTDTESERTLKLDLVVLDDGYVNSVPTGDFSQYAYQMTDLQSVPDFASIYSSALISLVS